MKILDYKNESLGITSQEIQNWITKHTKNRYIDWILRRDIFSDPICKHPLFKYVLYLELLGHIPTFLHDKWIQRYNTYLNTTDDIYLGNVYEYVQYELIQKGIVLDRYTKTLYKPEKIWPIFYGLYSSKQEDYCFIRNDNLYRITYDREYKHNYKLESNHNQPFVYPITTNLSTTDHISVELIMYTSNAVNRSVKTDNTRTQILCLINGLIEDDHLKEFMNMPLLQNEFARDILLYRFKDNTSLVLLLNNLIKMDFTIEQLITAAKTKDLKIEPIELPLIEF